MVDYLDPAARIAPVTWSGLQYGESYPPVLPLCWQWIQDFRMMMMRRMKEEREARSVRSLGPLSSSMMIRVVVKENPLATCDFGHTPHHGLDSTSTRGAVPQRNLKGLSLFLSLSPCPSLSPLGNATGPLLRDYLHAESRGIDWWPYGMGDGKHLKRKFLDKSQ